MKIYWRTHAIHFSITWAFCILIALAQYMFNPGHGFWIPFVYSMLIGSCTIGLVKLSSYLFKPPAHEHWPKGLKGLALFLLPLIFGYIAGAKLADLYFGWSSWENTSVLKTSVTISLIAGLAISYFFHTRSKQQELQAQLKATQLQATEAKLKLLEAQLDPHLLFNTLANLRVLIGIDAAKAQIMLDHMIAYLRATLSGSRASEHRLEQEFARLRDYLELMQIRMGPRLAFELDLPGVLKDHMVPTLLLQPLVENAIKHGLEPSKHGGRVRVQAQKLGENLLIEVSDTGLGGSPSDFEDVHDDHSQARTQNPEQSQELSHRLGLNQAPPLSQHSGHGYGLSQVRERLLTMYGPKGIMSIATKLGEGTQVRVQWPLQ